MAWTFAPAVMSSLATYSLPCAQAFINAVSAQRGNKIETEDADAIIAAAQAIIVELSTE